MTTFNYTGGALSNLTGNTPGANVSNLVTLLNDLKTFINGANLDATNLANNGVTAAKIEAQQAWQTVALVAGSTVFSPTTLSYMKDSLGFVHFRGDIFTITTAAISAGATLCTLPAGYRPGVTTRLSLAAYQATDFSLPRHIDITTAGVVSLANLQTISAAAGTQFSFGLCHFRAEN